jgi:hypothetical protein
LGKRLLAFNPGRINRRRKILDALPAQRRLSVSPEQVLERFELKDLCESVF